MSHPQHAMSLRLGLPLVFYALVVANTRVGEVRADLRPPPVEAVFDLADPFTPDEDEHAHDKRKCARQAMQIMCRFFLVCEVPSPAGVCINSQPPSCKGYGSGWLSWLCTLGPRQALLLLTQNVLRVSVETVLRVEQLYNEAVRTLIATVKLPALEGLILEPASLATGLSSLQHLVAMRDEMRVNSPRQILTHRAFGFYYLLLKYLQKPTGEDVPQPQVCSWVPCSICASEDRCFRSVNIICMQYIALWCPGLRNQEATPEEKLRAHFFVHPSMDKLRALMSSQAGPSPITEIGILDTPVQAALQQHLLHEISPVHFNMYAMDRHRNRYFGPADKIMRWLNPE
jgi:hypothetical protein